MVIKQKLSKIVGGMILNNWWKVAIESHQNRLASRNQKIRVPIAIVEKIKLNRLRKKIINSTTTAWMKAMMSYALPKNSLTIYCRTAQCLRLQELDNKIVRVRRGGMDFSRV